MPFETGATKEGKHLIKALSEEKRDLNPEDYSFCGILQNVYGTRIADLEELKQ